MAYADNDKYIKQITAIDQTTNTSSIYELDAKYWNGHQWSELADRAFSTQIFTTLPTITASNYSNYRAVVGLVADATAPGNYVEYVVVNTGTETTPTYQWEAIGTTATNFKIPMGGPTVTGTKATVTINTGNTDLGSATGSTTVLYQQATQANSAGGHTHSVTTTAHSHTVNASTTSVVNSITTVTGAAGGHSHTVNKTTAA